MPVSTQKMANHILGSQFTTSTFEDENGKQWCKRESDRYTILTDKHGRCGLVKDNLLKQVFRCLKFAYAFIIKNSGPSVVTSSQPSSDPS
jgi:hypothetical protein